MKSPEAAQALPELVAAGLLSPERAAPLAAIARGELVSVRAELRALLGLAVALVTTGVGLFVKLHHDALGPLPVALALLAGCAGAVAVAVRRSAPFTWQRSPARDWILDSLVLLAAGLAGGALAWIEVHYTALGADWPLHLLAMSVVTAALALRFDSLPAWTVALGTFAAWRGVSISPTAGGLERSLFTGEDGVRYELLLCAALFFALGQVAARTDRKRHFEPATSVLALVAAGVACTSGVGESETWGLWTLALGVLGAVAATASFRARRRGLFALACLALYVAVTRLVFALPGAGGLSCLWFAASTVGAIGLLVLIQRRFPAAEPAS